MPTEMDDLGLVTEQVLLEIVNADGQLLLEGELVAVGRLPQAFPDGATSSSMRSLSVSLGLAARNRILIMTVLGLGARAACASRAASA